jgi:hypothetical protein
MPLLRFYQLRPPIRATDVASKPPALHRMTLASPTTDERLRSASALLRQALALVEGSERQAIASDGALTPQDAPQSLVAPLAPLPPFVPDVQHRAILGALRGRALKKDALAETTGISAGAIIRKLAPLRERGLVAHQFGVGYYRPDALPVG